MYFILNCLGEAGKLNGGDWSSISKPDRDGRKYIDTYTTNWLSFFNKQTGHDFELASKAAAALRSFGSHIEIVDDSEWIDHPFLKNRICYIEAPVTNDGRPIVLSIELLPGGMAIDERW